MFCPKCGAQVGDYDRVCSSCGANVQFDDQFDARGPRVSQNALPMKWFKFLIYFGLFAGAVLNAISGIQMLTGAQYDGYEDLVYAVFDGLKTVDVLAGLALLALAALGIYTRMRLAGYYKNGPQMLTYVYAGGVAINLLYVLGVHMVLGELAEDIDMTSMITSLILLVVDILYAFVDPRIKAQYSK